MPQSKSKMRNLAQFKNMTDDEFDVYWEGYSVKSDEDIESRVQKIMDELATNYDLRDMFVNDMIALKEYARVQVLLDDLTQMERSAVEDGEINKLSTLSKIRKEYLDNQAKIADNLNITRKSRQTDSETLESYLPAILKKARNFYSQRLSYIYCPNCKMLVANAWFNNWTLNNRLTFVCPRPECSHEFTTTSEYLHEHGNKNMEGVLHV